MDNHICEIDSSMMTNSTRITIGFVVASIFSLAHIVIPLYLIGACAFFAMKPGLPSVIFMTPALISAILPLFPSPGIVRHDWFKAMNEYFDYEEVLEMSDDKLLEYISKNTKLDNFVAMTF